MNLNYKSFGQGPPLVILHGLFGTLDNWQTLAKRWAEFYTVILVDLRNHGRSPKVDHINYPAMAEDLHQFLEQQWIYKTHLLGHSMGGKTAMQFALQYPDYLDRLVVVDMGIRGYPGGHEVIFEALLSLDLATLTDRKVAEAQLAERIEERGIRQFLLKNLSRTKAGGFEWKMNLPVLHQDYAQILAPIDGPEPYAAPSLFVRGGQSNYVPDADWPQIQTLFPAAQLKTVPEAGHWVHAEAPEALFGIVNDFLRNPD